MDVVTDTLSLGPYVTCFQDVLIHGQNARGIRRAIESISPDYLTFMDTDSLASNDIRKTNYGGWWASGMGCLTLLQKRVFDTQKCVKLEWRDHNDRRTNLGKGRILWIKATTVTGKRVNILNVYQATSDKPDVQQSIYVTLKRALDKETVPCILLGDFNASMKGGRYRYAKSSSEDPTTSADMTFTEFVEKTGGIVLPPIQVSWKNPFRGTRGQETRLDFAVIYNLQEEMVEDYTDWISVLHDHTRVGYAIGESLWGTVAINQSPTQHPKTPKNGNQ